MTISERTDTDTPLDRIESKLDRVLERLGITNPKPPGVPTGPGGIMFSAEEIAAAPSSGPLFDSAKSLAAAEIGKVDLADQDKDNAATCYVNALLFARTGETAFRAKVEAALAKLVGAPTPPRHGERGGVLPVVRQLAGWVIAADLVGYRPPEFVTWVSEIRTRHIGGHGWFDVVTTTSRETANNWGTHALAGRTACSAYLSDTNDLAECASIFMRYTGADRTAWESWRNTDDHDDSWVDAKPAAGINAAEAKPTIAGAVVEDICRGPSAPRVNEVGLSYSWEALQGSVVTAKLLSRARSENCFSWGENALLRAAKFIHGKSDEFDRPPFGAYPPRHPESQWVPIAIDKCYGTSLSSTGRPPTRTDRGWSIAAAHWLF